MTETNTGRFQQFSQDRPILFAILITFIMLVFYIFAAILAQVFGRSTISFNLIEAAGRLGGAIVFVFVILRFNWQKETGLTRFGTPAVWLLSAVILIYEVITYVYPYLGNLDLASANLGETVSVALNALTTGPLEEFRSRGLILIAFLLAWSGAKGGVWKAVLTSAVIFGASHMIHVLFGREILRAAIISLNAALGGIIYAAILIRWQTIWPVIALHSGLNVLASIVAFNVPGYSESPETLLISTAFSIPLAILAVVLIERSQRNHTERVPA